MLFCLEKWPRAQQVFTVLLVAYQKHETIMINQIPYICTADTPVPHDVFDSFYFEVDTRGKWPQCGGCVSGGRAGFPLIARIVQSPVPPRTLGKTLNLQ